MKINTNQLKAKLADPKIRTLVVFVGVLVVAVIIYLFSRQSQEAVPGVPTVARGAQIPAGIESIAGQNPSEEYNALQAEANRRNAEEAIKQGGTAVASILHSEPEKEPKKDDKPKTVSPEELYQKTLAQQQLNEARQREEAARRQLLEQQIRAQQAQSDADAKGMIAQAKALLGLWTAVPAQAVVGGVVPTEEEKAAAAEGAAAAANAAAKDQGGPLLIRAGDIIFASLDTEVNTDDGQGIPVLATIVAGPFKGAKVLGTVTRHEDKAVLQFTTMSAPFLQRSVLFSALAINPDTARAGLASEVNHHYLLRYGSMFAAAFLQGWGNALSNTSTFFTPLGSIEVQKNTSGLTSRQQIQIGLGQVGTTLGSHIGETFNRPPTVTIKAGSSVGLLILQDVRQNVLVDPNQMFAQQQLQANLAAASAAASRAQKAVAPVQQMVGVSAVPGFPVYTTPTPVALPVTQAP